jgi:hypothetical protein
MIAIIKGTTAPPRNDVTCSKFQIRGATMLASGVSSFVSAPAGPPNHRFNWDVAGISQRTYLFRERGFQANWYVHRIMKKKSPNQSDIKRSNDLEL